MSGIFDNLAEEIRWVPFQLVYNPEREKYDKVPNNSKRNLSTTNSDDWLTFIDAWALTEKFNLSGVGFIMTGGYEQNGWSLVALDYDKVDFHCFKFPFDTYAEKSPSGTGIRAFMWVPSNWAKKFRDTVKGKAPHCEHVEIYFGTSPRFVTVTFENINENEIAFIKGDDLVTLEAYGLLPFEDDSLGQLKPYQFGDGVPIELRLHNLSEEQKQLINGVKGINRSDVLHGLLIKLIDANQPIANILATLLKQQALFTYLMEHREGNPTKALKFAQEEIERAYKKSERAKREKLVAFNPKWKDPEPEVAKEVLPFPRELYDNAPGVLGEVARWIFDAAYVPRIEYAYACALSMMACLIGPYCTVGPRKGKLNLFFVLVGGTGAGKNEAMDTMSMLLNETDAKDSLADFPASEAGLRRHLNVNPNLLIRADELAHKLDSMKNNANGSALGRAILEAYNGARMAPKPYADAHRNLEAVENPFVQILGGTTEKIWEVVKSSHMEDGTLNRFIFVCLPDELEYVYNSTPNCNIPKELKDKLNAFFRQGKMYDLIGYVPPGHGRQITIPAEITALVEVMNKDEIWPLTQKEFGKLYNRFVQNMEKIAAILAVCEGHKEISMENFMQAKAFMKWCLDNTYDKISTRMFETNFERYSKKLLARVKKTGGLRTRDAYRYMKISRREMEEIINTLSTAGEILIVEKENNSNNNTKSEWLFPALEDED